MRKNKTIILVFPTILTFLILLSGSTWADKITVQLPYQSVKITHDANGYACFHGKDLQYLSGTGEPAIPYRVLKALLPPNADLGSINITTKHEDIETVAGQWKVRPTPPLATWDGENILVEWPLGKSIEDGEDTDIYHHNALFPANITGSISSGNMRKWVLVDIPVALFQYSPGSQTLYRLKQAKFAINFNRKTGDLSPQQATALLADRIGEDRIKKMVINFDDMASEYMTSSQTATPLAGTRYVIITTSFIQSSSSQLNSFIAAQEARGYTVQVVTESQWGGGTGNTAAENIRSWLQSNYISLDIEYVLFIGNPNPSSGDVPMKMLWPRNNATSYPSYKEAPSDYYYADLTGNWDLDNDGKYGEYGYSHDFGIGGVDRNWEVLVGRIPYYGSLPDLDNILAKITTYETSSSSSIGWRKKALFPMEPSDGSTPGYHLGEKIKDEILSPLGDWDHHRVYEENYGLSPSPETVPCNTTNVKNAWNGSQFGAIFWWTHGSSTYAADIMNLTNAATLDNNFPGFTFQCSCLNAYPENTSNLGYSLLKNGAIATVAATRVSWYYVGQTSYNNSPSNAGMTYEYAERLIGNNSSCGEALLDLKQSLSFYSESLWMNFCVFNVYGNPATALNDHLLAHEVSTPDAPDGKTLGEINISHSYTTSGATCSFGHDVEYRFDWDDSTFSTWSSSPNASHFWGTANSYSVRAQARCSSSTEIISNWSDGLTVNIYTCLTPEEPTNPTPSHEAEAVDINTDLDWDDAELAISYDVYFDNSYPPSYVGNTTESSYALPELDYETSYYWKIVAKNACNDTSGEDWNFSTGETPRPTDFFIPFGSLNKGNVNLGNISNYEANVTVRIRDQNGSIVLDDTFMTIPSKGVALTWDLINNIYNYGKPLIVEIESDQHLVADNTKWADNEAEPNGREHVGAAMTCQPVETMKGKLFYFTFSTMSSAKAYCCIANTENSSANVTLQIYNTNGNLMRAENIVIPALGMIRSWKYIGNIGSIASPALVKVSSDKNVVIDAIRWEDDCKGWTFAVLPAATAGGQKFFVPFGSLNRGNINMGNISTTTANISLRLRDKYGTQIGSTNNFTIPANGIALTWDIIGNIYNYGKPITVEIQSDQALVADNIKWADDLDNPNSKVHIGAAMTCLPEDVMKGKLLYFTYYTMSTANSYSCIANTETTPANVTLQVYDANGNLQQSKSLSIPALGMIRSWDYIGNIGDIASPSLIKISSDKNVVADAIRWENNCKGWTFAVLPIKE